MAQSTDRIAGDFLQLLQRFIQLRPRLIVSEEIVNLRRRMEKLKSRASGFEGRHQLLRILITIANSPEPPTMGDLSSCLGLPLSSSTRIMDGLVRAGFVERINDARDRRVVRVQMTETGRELLQTALSYNKQRVLHLLGKFTPAEQAQFLKLLTKLYESLAAENETA